MIFLVHLTIKIAIVTFIRYNYDIFDIIFFIK